MRRRGGGGQKREGRQIIRLWWRYRLEVGIARDSGHLGIEVGATELDALLQERTQELNTVTAINELK